MPKAAPSVDLVILLLLTAISLAGCALFDSDSNAVTARSDGLRVTIKNETGDRIYYFLVGSELATLIDWIPHLDDSQSVAAGRSRPIDHDDIMMEEDETQAIFYWWKAAIRDGERVPGAIVSNIIDL
jgi:hypothetical protein